MEFRGELPLESLPPIDDIPVVSLMVWCAISAVPREDHVVHVEGIPPSNFQIMSCKRAGRKEDRRDLAFQGLAFLPPDVEACLLGAPQNIAEAYQLIFLLPDS